MKYDVVIVGAGVAGLYCALHLPKNLKVLLLCKEEAYECNTFYAQGGISVALDEDDVASHIDDTMSAGSFLNQIQSVQTLCKESLSLILDLENLGLSADKDEKGKVVFAKEGGHKKARIIHFDGDGSGRCLHQHLLSKLEHTLWDNTQVVDLLIDEGHCYGVSVQRGGDIFQIYADYVVLASGGIGGLYTYHTNARTLSADLHGMILENHLKLKDMEMMQFHPTVYTKAPIARKPLISEAVRGEGGIVVDREGRRFLFDYDERGELAPRDIVARGIFDYCTLNAQEAFLDLSHFSKEGFIQRFPNIYQSLHSFGVDLPKEKVPISPAFHYCMGGIEVDMDDKVKGVDNLFAIGECANNGIHGANRLASNSLLEGLVFGKRVAEKISCSSFKQKRDKAFAIINQPLVEANDFVLKNTLRKIMWDKVGIIRTHQGLKMALEEVEKMREEKRGRMLDLRLLVAREIILHALARKQSLGAHYLKDDV